MAKKQIDWNNPNNVDALYRASGLPSFEAFAHELGVPSRTAWRWWKGDSKPSVMGRAVLERFARKVKFG